MINSVLSNKLTNEQLTYAQQCISAARSIVILTHQNPDGDAMGSSLGMRFLLQALGKNDVTNIVPTPYPDFLAWLPGAGQILPYENDPQQAEKCVSEADLVICTDLAEAKRVAALSDVLARRTAPMLIIDHHLSAVCTEQPWQIAYPDSASACELVFRLAYQWAAKQPDTDAFFSRLLTPDFATCIYTGMMTDTGNFSYNSCHPEMYSIIAILLTTGINKDAIYDQVFNAFSADRMMLVGYCLYRKMQIFPQQQTALITLNRREIYRFNAKSGDMEGIVNMPLQIKNVKYSVFMREDKIPPHQKEEAGDAKVKTKISFRSQGDRPVNKLAREHFRGGGHANAAGGEYFGTAEQAAGEFIRLMPHYFQTN